MLMKIKIGIVLRAPPSDPAHHRGDERHICRCTGYVCYYAALRELILADPKLSAEAKRSRRS
jgi:aerobic-type carbon monoxide dehydrogenase small subunit (CoxS/CutS family)